MGSERVDLPSVEYSAIFPELLLVGGALLLLLISSMFREKAGQAVYSLYTVLVSGAAVISAFMLRSDVSESGPHSAFSGALANDHFHLFFVIVIGSALLLSTLVGGDWAERRGIHGPELHVLAMLSASGGMFMAAANDLIVVFLGLEILSIALYVMVGFNKTSDRSREAALKYFLLGGFSSAVFLYGVALVYGTVGTTNLSGIAAYLSNNFLMDDGLLLAGIVLLVVGFGFKVAAVPFHQWTPDVYEGAPTPVTGFMAAVAKAGAFAAFLRVFMSALFTASVDWKPVILALAVLTLLVGSVVACVQNDVKRMLAYSSISHAGYILLGLQAANRDGVSAALYYVLVYAFIIVGSFAIVSAVGGRNDNDHDLEVYRGLGRRNPGIALAFTVLLLAQAGVPLTAGFLAKYYVISSLVENASYATAVFAMLVAAVAAFFYLRLTFLMWGAPNEEPEEVATGVAPSTLPSIPPAPAPALTLAPAPALFRVPDLRLPPATWLAAAVAVLVTVGLGVLPGSVIDAVSFARDAAGDLFPSATSAGNGSQPTG